MLGCKFSKRLWQQALWQELIDTCWDVNLVLLVYLYMFIRELIDTCWDVNMIKRRERHIRSGELIDDTCWDVNGTAKLAQVLDKRRINRYMLGCKYSGFGVITGGINGINRYMLGCKSIYSALSFGETFGINRYMLGCKSNISSLLHIDLARINRYMLGCKCTSSGVTCCSASELIDTCWDVNIKYNTIKDALTTN